MILDGLKSADLIFVVFNNNVLMCIKHMLVIIAVFIGMQLTNKAYKEHAVVLQVTGIN